MPRLSSSIVRALLLPGTVVHELSHATAVILTPGVRLTEFDATSHVAHEGRYTVSRAFFISYAPLILHSGLALLATITLLEVSLRTPTDIATAVGLAYAIAALGVTALPSWADAVFPLSLCKQRLRSLRGLLLFPLSSSGRCSLSPDSCSPFSGDSPSSSSWRSGSSTLVCSSPADSSSPQGSPS